MASIIKSKEDGAYSVNPDDLIPLVNNASTVAKSVTPNQLVDASNPAALSDATKLQFREVVTEPEVLTVGSNSRFPTFDDVLTYILNNTPAKTQFAAALGGTATVSQYDDVVTFAGMSTTLNAFGTTDALTFPFWIEFNDDGSLYLVDKLISGTSLRLMAGLNASTHTSVTFKLWRLPAFNIELGIGVFECNAVYDLQDLELCLSITGKGKTLSAVSEINATVGGTLKPPRAGSFELSNCSFNGTGLAIFLHGVELGDAGLWGRYLSLVNVVLTKGDVFAGTDVMNMGAAATFINGLEVSGKGDTFIIYSDKLFATNITLVSESLGPNGFSFRCDDNQCTKTWFINDCSAFANTSNTGGIWLQKNTTDVNVAKDVFIQSCLAEAQIHAINDSGVISKFIVYAKNNTLASFESDGSTIEETGNNKLDGSALDAPTLSNSGVVN